MWDTTDSQTKRTPNQQQKFLQKEEKNGFSPVQEPYLEVTPQVQHKLSTAHNALYYSAVQQPAAAAVTCVFRACAPPNLILIQTV